MQELTNQKKEKSEVVSATTQLKLLAPDGKKRLSDMQKGKPIYRVVYL